MKIVLIGANGQLGRCFQDSLPEEWQLKTFDSKELDISDKAAVMAAIITNKPDVIVNAAAYTAVDKAESEPERAIAVNTHGPENLALAAKFVGARFVHVSTDYVFDGTAKIPYVETDAVNPLGVYGKSKLGGELLVSALMPSAIILRTAWVFSEYGNNFVKTMLRLAESRDSLGIVSDQYGCPTYAGDIADSIIKMIKISAVGGVYHYCGNNRVSWAEFAKLIFSKAESFGVIKKIPRIQFISTDDYPTPAVRPKFSVLSTQKLNALNIPPSSWQESLCFVLDKLRSSS